MTITLTIGTALSVASGRLLCDFDDLHGAITELAGWPVFTHHLANKELADGCAAKVIDQVSWMPGAIENMPAWETFPPDQVRPAIDAWLDRIAEQHGGTVELDTGEPLPYLHVLAGLENLGRNR